MVVCLKGHTAQLRTVLDTIFVSGCSGGEGGHLPSKAHLVQHQRMGVSSPAPACCWLGDHTFRHEGCDTETSWQKTPAAQESVGSSHGCPESIGVIKVLNTQVLCVTRLTLLGASLPSADTLALMLGTSLPPGREGVKVVRVTHPLLSLYPSASADADAIRRRARRPAWQPPPWPPWRRGRAGQGVHSQQRRRRQTSTAAHGRAQNGRGMGCR